MNKSSPYRKLVKKATKEFIPLNVTFELTHSCNLSCIHCYVVKNKTRKELSTQEVLSILDQLAEAGCLFLNFTGGEILTRDDFFAIARHARAKKFALRLLTNGTLITPQVARQLQEISPLSIEISIYGANPQTHDKITKTPGSFKKTTVAVELLKNLELPVVFKTTLMNQNFGEYKQIIEMAKNWGIKLTCDPTITPRNDGSKDVLRLRVSNQNLHQFFSDIKWGKSLNQKHTDKHNANKEICGAARRGCTISPCGDVYPCVGLRTPAGDLKEESFRQIWDASEQLSKIRALTVSDLEECASCKTRPYCRPCMGLAFLETGKLTSKSHFVCQVAKAKKETAKKQELRVS